MDAVGVTRLLILSVNIKEAFRPADLFLPQTALHRRRSLGLRDAVVGRDRRAARAVPI
jgi:hypothetical protein